MRDIRQLEETARKIRKNILVMTTNAGSGHPGGSLSSADIVVALYFYKMRHNSQNPEWPDRDRFVLSKGHSCPLLYAVLAECGYFPKEELKNLRKIDCLLQGHPCITTPGIEIPTGSLGQGLSVANGIAIAGKLDKKDYRVYCLIGDGESQEGQIWEAAMTASHYKLDNLIAILDNNRLQIDGFVKDIMNVFPLKEKWKSFGWHVWEIDGHDFEEIINTLDEADRIEGKPKIIIANTTKGKGISFMENKAEFHGKTLTKEQLNEALKEL